MDENNDESDDDINYSPDPVTPTGKNIEPTVDKHVVAHVAAPARSWSRRGIKYYRMSILGSMQAMSKSTTNSAKLSYIALAIMSSRSLMSLNWLDLDSAT